MHPFIRLFDDLSVGNVPAADLHMHTTWTDGARSVAEMHGRAIEAGLTHILFSEHSRRTSGDWFSRFAAEVRALPTDQCHALVGTEVKIDDFEGRLDIADDVRRECDLIMASVHRFPGEAAIDKSKPPPFSPDEAVGIEFELSRAAIIAGGFHILGHPFGMSIKRFGAQPPLDLVKELAILCARHRVALEINAHYHPQPWALIELCQQVGAPISLGSNAHDAAEVGAIVRLLRSNPSP